jgi:hypothetical protein
VPTSIHKRIGPVLLVLGVVIVLAVALSPLANASPLARWILNVTLAPAQVLPLAGLGVAFALLGSLGFAAALFLFLAGIVAGLATEYWLLWALDTIPRAANNFFLIGPISYLAAGLALVGNAHWRARLTPIAAFVSGAMLALNIRLTDPSLHEIAYTVTPLLVVLWVVGAVALTMNAFRRDWFAIFGRILGCWLLAIGILYGGVSLMPPKALPLPPAGEPAPRP